MGNIKQNQFLIISSSFNKNSRIQKMPSNTLSFGQSQIAQIQKLEQLFHNKYLTADFLHELVALYVRAIEMFNRECTFMRGYFLEKMQFVVSRPQIIAMLENGGDKVEEIRETVRATEDEMNPKQDRQFLEHKRLIVQKQTHHHYHYEQTENKNKQRNKKIDMKVKIMREVEENMKNLEKQVKEQDLKLQQKDNLVKKIAKNQEDKLQERLGKRMKKKPRKKSEEAKPNIQNQEQPEPIIQKQELIEAQRQLTIAVAKFTIRMTEKFQGQQEKKQNISKGRVKVKKIESIDDEDQDLLQEDQPNNAKQKNHIQGRIKTTRRDDDQSEYW